MAWEPENLVGRKIGKLTVIGEPKKINNAYFSLCKCDCGREKLIRNFSLKHNKSKSCGCGMNNRKPENLIGRNFGKLTVIGESKKINNKFFSLCKCKCGNEKLMNNGNLKNGTSKSCGCSMRVRKPEGLVGRKNGKLTVIGESKKINNEFFSLCKCECGNEKLIRNGALKKGVPKSCGCSKHTRKKTTNLVEKKIKIKSEIPKKIKSIFYSMRARCQNPNTKCYNYYGGRGIKVCEEWLKDINSFYIWALKSGYNENLSIERIDVNGDYEPSNCKWATRTDQANNKRNNVFLTYNNEKKTIAQWARIYNISPSKIKYRYKKGLPFEEIFEINKNKV